MSTEKTSHTLALHHHGPSRSGAIVVALGALHLHHRVYSGVHLLIDSVLDHLVKYYVMSRPIGWWGPVRAEAKRRGSLEPAR